MAAVGGAEIPQDDAARIQWLNDQWRQVNAWVAARSG